MINLERLEQAAVTADPFAHVVVGQVIAAEDLQAVTHDFPPIDQPGLFPLSDLTFGPAFRRLVADLRRREFAGMMERKLGVDLVDKPLMITVRGWCSAKRDGRPHTDSEDKIATGLIYLNDEDWNEPGGRLRFLHSGDVNDVLAEVPPLGGTLVAFRRTDRSWHGHQPFDGQRRYVMFNWLRSEVRLAKNLGRHKLSAAIKRLSPFHGA